MGRKPTPEELKYAEFTAQTPHYVLSSSMDSAQWSQTSFIRSLKQVTALKKKAGQDIYLVGGGQTVASLIDAGLVDELRLIVYPIIAGEGKTLLVGMKHRRGLELKNVRQLEGGRASLVYGIG
ncbi:MAG: dihydrofolate reductase family protein [Nitrospirae bacterium]|nr:dihydrofolate reductase family protein [Nitrospirota bacterium]